MASDERRLLSTAEREAMRERVNESSGTVVVAGVEQERDIRDLLAHLDALDAPADGEALGRLAWECAEAKWIGLVLYRWHELPDDVRAYYAAVGLALYQRGHAAGVLSREPEIAALRLTIEREAEKLTAISDNLRHMYGVADEQKATIVRLTAELAEARGLILRNAETIRQLEANVYSTEKSRAAARADGEREEREACIADMRGEIDDTTERAFMIRVCERIASRARGDR